MNTKYLSLNDSRKRKIVKCISEVVPDIMIAILFCYLIIKAIYSGDVSWLMIAPQQYYCLRIFELVQEK